VSLTAIIAYISSVSAVLPFFALLIDWRKGWCYNKWLSVFIIYDFLSEFLTFTMAMLKIRNLEAFLLMIPIDAFILMFIYRDAFRQPISKKLTYMLMPVFLIGYIAVYLLLDYRLRFPSYAIAYYQLITVIPVLMYFYERMLLVDDIIITDNPMFWVSCGFLLFHSVSIFYFSFHYYLLVHYPGVESKGWWIHSSMLTAMNVLLTIGIWKIPRTIVS
jgi:hypothetical protein